MREDLRESAVSAYHISTQCWPLVAKRWAYFTCRRRKSIRYEACSGGDISTGFFNIGGPACVVPATAGTLAQPLLKASNGGTAISAAFPANDREDSSRSSPRSKMMAENRIHNGRTSLPHLDSHVPSTLNGSCSHQLL